MSDGTWQMLGRAVLLGLLVAGCSTAHAGQASRVVAAAPPPKDDGKTAEGGSGGDRHSAALEQLKVAPIVTQPDKQGSLRIPLPDGSHWTRVRFLTVKTLVGFRYGKDHHAMVGGIVTHVEDNSVQGACTKSFEQYAAPILEAFEIELKHEPPLAFTWSPPTPKAAGATKRIEIVEVDALHGKTATILSHESYEAAWAAYPAWGTKACLVLGVAVPERDDPARAKAVRDRFLRDVFPKVTVTTLDEPKEQF